jgi:DNA adenine methylase
MAVSPFAVSGVERKAAVREPSKAVPLKPPLKWAGGKRWLVPHLLPLYEPYRRYRLVEPFCGGLAVTLALSPAQALLNDINPHTINFYRWLQRGLTLRIKLENDAELFYEHREEFNRLIAGRGSQTRKAAEIFYFLNRTGYNGLCRFNRRGEFNVPFGRYTSIPYRRDFTAYRASLATWDFSNQDFEDLALDAQDWIYADPPYDVEFRHYAAGGFGWDDQVRLAQWLARHRGPIVASNQATPRILDLYQGLGFEICLLDAPRMISCNGDRRPAKEMLALRGLR